MRRESTTNGAVELALRPEAAAQEQLYAGVSTEIHVVWFDAMAPLLRAGALLPTIGNHENENDGAEYDDYYGRLFVPAGPDASESPWYQYAVGGAHVFAIDTEEPLALDSPQTVPPIPTTRPTARWSAITTTRVCTPSIPAASPRR